jgi:hypothetical protein
MSTIKSPQEKKRLAYQRDRRNGFGQNAKASRRLIPLRKKKAEKAYRKRANQEVGDLLATNDTRAEESAEGQTALVRKKGWRKAPDNSLSETVERKKRWRVLRYGRKTGKAQAGPGFPGWHVNAKLNHVDQEGILDTKARRKPKSAPQKPALGD